MKYYPFYILAAAVIHITEEFIYPGSFIRWAKMTFPRFGDRITNGPVFIINLLFVLLCIAGIVTDGGYPGLSLSIAGLILVNGSAHVISSIIRRSYSPGLLTSLLLYIPLSILIFIYRDLKLSAVLLNILYGILYHAVVPIILFFPINRPLKRKEKI
jgi:hypothetical protein